LKCLKTFEDDVLDDSFGEALIKSSLQDVGEAASIEILDKDPETVFEIVSIVILHNVTMIAD